MTGHTDDAGCTSVTCAACGSVLVEVATVEVHVDAGADLALFAVPCPGCDELVVGGDRERIRALLRQGARRRELRSTSSPPLCHDDLLDLHEWLATDAPWPAAPWADESRPTVEGSLHGDGSR